MRLRTSAKHQVREFVLIGRMALEEMHHLDEATGAPIDFANKGITRKTAARTLWDDLKRIGSFLFTKKPWQKSEAPKPVDEEKAIASLRPREAFEIGLQRIKEYQYQGTFPMMIIGAATNLSLLGYYQQHGHMNIIDGSTAPAILAFNLIAGYAATRLMERCSTIRLVRESYKTLGEDGLTREIDTMHKAIKAHDQNSISERIRQRISRLQGNKHD